MEINTNKHKHFIWYNLGKIKEARGELGEEMPIFIYRLMQYTILDVLSKTYGIKQANKFVRQAGHLAGTEFAENALYLAADFYKFIDNLKKILLDLKIGIFNLETYNQHTGEIIFTISQDLDYSGMSISDEKACVYNEGFIAGILETYTGKNYYIQKINCQENGMRICRFSGDIME